MSLSCDAGAGHDGSDWWWFGPEDEAPLTTKRSRKCCSCGVKVSVGDTARKIQRYRPATEWEERRGFASEVKLANWYLCETCDDLADSISELGFCYSLGGDTLAEQIAEYRREEAAARNRLATLNAELERLTFKEPV